MWATVLVIALCALVVLAIVCSMIFDKNIGADPRAHGT